MIDVFSMMAEELESSYPETIKIPGREGGYIRVPVAVNAEWYRVFCGLFTAPRRRYPKPRTIIRRCDCLRALRRLAEGNQDGVYAERLIEFAQDWYIPHTITERTQTCDKKQTQRQARHVPF